MVQQPGRTLEVPALLATEPTSEDQQGKRFWNNWRGEAWPAALEILQAGNTGVR